MARGLHNQKNKKATKAPAKPTKTSLDRKKGSGTSKAGCSSRCSSSRSSSSSSSGLSTPKQVSDAVYAFMCNEHSFGMTEWSRLELANAIGYANPRSDKFAKGLKILVSEAGLAEKGSVGGSLVLSKTGIADMPKDCGAKTLGDVHERFLVQLEQKCKLGSDKVRTLWGILKDRKVHKVSAVAKELGYGNPRSFGNTKLIPLMKSMGLVNEAGKGNVQMSDKPFPSNLVD
eukprot:CAMPEP_0172384146 /NCGR_PEP_ID=MMETSP1061-20121228/1945_1 /TAXON_ID=37318 /ORGANISM="Pseudo-nitzschia pungens, Strain cf. pungens" /LENGTH=229 /DNA_ID=CAMNT_0013112669 /DNA_START=228 /DNA_END=917 /DNA_ORIENTATION=+